ncbi:MAG: hypothetical protein HRU50_10970 [Winogradskyella sp.]|uniref:hypothetical protein n=1 Tax=Winogradskyella sp. TaxID=1883156 RepID=UPI0025DF5826|nr:hypothetical protein [Winogradskyella sp.]NRB60444.1 hypothetical protein [Winogradskyella sp.]
MQKIYITSAVLFISALCIHAQNIYKEQLEGCDTKMFALESETKTAHIDDTEIIKALSTLIDDTQRNKIKGKLKLQIIVYTDSSSCLLSYENDTNMKTTNLNIEEFRAYINENLVWTNKDKNVAALIEIKFKKKKVVIERLGMDGKRGWHILD